MTRPLRTTLAAISLVLCGLSAGACVVSYVRPLAFVDAHSFYYAGSELFENVNGRSVAVSGVRLHYTRMSFEHSGGRPVLFESHKRGIGDAAADKWIIPTWLPYIFSDTWEPSGTDTLTQWTLPLPLLVLLFAILPVRWAILRRRERRRNAAKVCVRCGYDLRACEERCSECGEPIPLTSSRR